MMIAFQKIQVELDFNLLVGRPRANGLPLSAHPDPAIFLSVSGRHTLEFESNQAFHVVIRPEALQPGEEIPPGIDRNKVKPNGPENPFDLTNPKMFEADSAEQNGMHTVICGAVDREFSVASTFFSYKYIANSRLTQSIRKVNPDFKPKVIDPHIIIGP